MTGEGATESSSFRRNESSRFPAMVGRGGVALPIGPVAGAGSCEASVVGCEDNAAEATEAGAEAERAAACGCEPRAPPAEVEVELEDVDANVEMAFKGGGGGAMPKMLDAVRRPEASSVE